MKILLLIFSLFSFLLPIQNSVVNNNSLIYEKRSEYLSSVNDAYSKYNINEYTNPNYDVIVVEGICNNVTSYGIMLVSKDANSYDIKISVDDIMYKINEDERGDTLYIALRKPNKEVKVFVYDNYQGNKTKRWEYTLTSDTTYLTFGLNNGCDFNKLILNDVFYIIKTIALIVLALIALTIVIILLMYINKIGFFKSKQTKVVSIKDEINDKTIFIDNDVKEIKEIEKNNDFDIKKYLNENGYNTDYNLMPEEEKNKIMIVLMNLKYQNMINEEEYESEVIKLWKK